MSDSRLLPTGSSPLEVAAAKACAEIEKTPVSIRELWNPDTCPANLLPWLAWSFSVDRWDDKWPEATKRAVIRDAYFIHCHNRTCSDDPLFLFENYTRTAQMLADTMAEAHMWAVDKPITATLIRDIVDGINAKFRELKTNGYIVDATCWFSEESNDAENVRAPVPA